MRGGEREMRRRGRWRGGLPGEQRVHEEAPE